MRSVGELTTRIFPARYVDASLLNYETGTDSLLAALTAARQMAEAELANLVLVGPPGTGKTHLAVGVVRHIVDSSSARYAKKVADYERATASRSWSNDQDVRHPAMPESPMWTNVASLIVSLRMEMDAPMDDRDAAAVVREIRRHRSIVVLDDLGREKTSDWTGEIVYDLVNARYENELPTIVTSNLTPAELAASPYWPAVSRLAENGALIKIEAPDYRLGGHRD